MSYQHPNYSEGFIIWSNMMFTQKHYVAIADLIHARRVAVRKMPTSELVVTEGEARLDEINTMTLALSKLFKADNPKFKEFTFIEACNRDLRE